jgi:hypothetical protein
VGAPFLDFLACAPVWLASMVRHRDGGSEKVSG